MQEQYDSSNDQELRVEYGGLTGVARVVKVGHQAVKWQISMLAENGRTICEMDGPEIVGDGPIVPSVDDIEKAQHEINLVIQQFLWDPMSRA